MTELLEMQGLTPDMVRDYLRGKGWSQHANGKTWMHKASHGMLTVQDGSLLPTIARLAEREQRPVQEVAAEVNPRLRPWPSAEAVQAHEDSGGRWLCKKPGDDGWLQVMEFGADITEDEPVAAADDVGDEYQADDCKGWRFWPCDANGNKVKWPTNEKGEML